MNVQSVIELLENIESQNLAKQAQMFGMLANYFKLEQNLLHHHLALLEEDR